MMPAAQRDAALVSNRDHIMGVNIFEEKTHDTGATGFRSEKANARKRRKFFVSVSGKFLVVLLNAVAVEALKSPDMVKKLQGAGFEPAPTAPEEFRKFIRSESAKFAKIITEAGIKLE